MKNFDPKDFTLNAVGIVLIFLGILAFYNGIVSSGVSGILWFSYAALFLIGVGVATRNSFLIASQLNIILIPYLFWNIDFFYVLFTGNSLWGVTDYFFVSRPFLAQLVTIQHVFIVPISLVAIYFIKLKRSDFWKISLAQIVVFFILIRILSNESLNVNCSFSNCLPFQFSAGFYPLIWFLAYAFMIVVTTLFLTKTNIFNQKTYKK